LEKKVAMLSFLHAVDILSLNLGDIKKLQTIENGMWRRVVNGRCYALRSVSRAEIGASSMGRRLAKSKLKYEAYMKNKGGTLDAYDIGGHD